MKKTISEILRLLLIERFIELPDIIKMADEKIAEGFDDIDLIEISLCKSTNSLFTYLSHIQGSVDYNHVINIYLIYLREGYLSQNRKNYFKTYKSLYSLMHDYYEHLSSEIRLDIYMIDEDYNSLIQDHDITMQMFIQTLDDFFDNYIKSKYYTYFKANIFDLEKLSI